MLVFDPKDLLYFTAVWLLPYTWSKCRYEDTLVEQWVQESDLGILRSLSLMKKVFALTLNEMSVRVEELYQCLDGLLPTNTILEPAEHDSFFFDEDSFNWSRCYFWVLDTIVECQRCIEYALRQRERLEISWEHGPRVNYQRCGKNGPGRKLYSKEIGESVNSLKQSQNRFESLAAKVQIMRDGASLPL